MTITKVKLVEALQNFDDSADVIVVFDDGEERLDFGIDVVESEGPCPVIYLNSVE